MDVRSLTSGLAFEDDQLDPLLSFGLPTRAQLRDAVRAQLPRD
jgi:hypothetical protein